jgi:hypothetical protein
MSRDATASTFFWRCLIASRTVTEAKIVYWCAVRGADETPYRNDDRALPQFFGLDRWAFSDAVASLVSANVLTKRVLERSWSELRLDRDGLFQWLERPTSGWANSQQLAGTDQVSVIGPTIWGGLRPAWANSQQLAGTDQVSVVGPTTLALVDVVCRYALLADSRPQAIVLAWLGSMAAQDVVLPSRSLEATLGGLVARRTAMRAIDDLGQAGLIAATTEPRKPARLMLRQCAVLQRVLVPPPTGPEAEAVLPGWANLDFRLLGQWLAYSEPAAEAMEEDSTHA